MSDLKDKIKYFRKSYDEGKPLITDYEFDLLVQRLKQNEDSCLKEEFLKSMDAVYDKNELYSFINKYTEHIIVEPKIDGISALLIYKDYILVKALTRGSKAQSADITQQILGINVPLQISIKNAEIRGELCISRKDFNTELKYLYSSARSAVSGAFFTKDIEQPKQRKVQFVAFNFFNTGSLNHLEDKEIFNNVFTLVPTIQNKLDIEQLDFHMQDILQNLPWDNDGVVLKINDYELRQTIGTTSTVDKWMIAYKHNKFTYSSIVRDIQWNIGRTGKITPILIIDDVNMDNRNINRITIFNIDTLKKYSIGRNSTIEIALKSDVMPVFVSVLVNTDDKFIIPEQCPSCNTKLDHDICINIDCNIKKVQNLLNFVKQSNIKYVGISLCQKLVTYGIDNAIKLFSASNEKILNALKSEAITKKFIEELNYAREYASAETILSSLGINGCGLNVIKKLSKDFITLSELIKIKDPKVFMSILGKKIGRNFFEYLNYNLVDIEALVQIKDYKFNMYKNE